MPQQPMLFCEVFDVWAIDFMGLFPVYFGFAYILLVFDYDSKWVEAKSTRTSKAKEHSPPILKQHIVLNVAQLKD